MSLEETLKTRVNKAKDWLIEHHIVPTTGLLVATNPLYALSEAFNGMSDQELLSARITATVANYAGIGFAYSAIRNKVVQRIPDTKVARVATDAVFGAVMSIPFGTLFYGTPKIVEYIQTGTVQEMPDMQTLNTMILNVPLSAGFAVFGGSAIDLANDVCGYMNTKATKLRSASKKTKRAVAALAIATSLAVVTGAYTLANEPKVQNNTTKPHYSIQN